MIVGRGDDEIRRGDEFRSAMTMTETRLVIGRGLFGDINPLPVNQQFAAQSRFGGRIVDGFLGCVPSGWAERRRVRRSAPPTPLHRRRHPELSHMCFSMQSGIRQGLDKQQKSQ